MKIRARAVYVHVRLSGRFNITCCGLLLATLTPFMARAQTAQTQTAAASDTLQEVVVTAERRESDLQKTPVAVTAVSQDALVRAGATDLTDLAKVMPDVITTGGGASASPSIRGIASGDSSPTAEARSAIYVDGGVLAKPRGTQGFLYDVQRVEVDKGPQGTLFGRDTNGGALQIITNKPSLGQMQGEGEVEAGSYNLVRTSGWLNMPLGDTVAIRGAFQTYEHSGYMLSGLNDANTHAGRVSILWKASDTDTLWIVADSSSDHSFADSAVSNVVGVEPGVTNIYVPSNPRDDTFYDGHAKSSSSPFSFDAVVQGLTINNDLNLGFATWTTLFSHRYFDEDPSIGPNNPTSGPAAVAPNGLMYPSGARNYVPQTAKSYQLETRLTSTATMPLQWVIGLYLYRDHDGGTMIGYANDTTTVPSIEISQPYEVAQSGSVYGQATYTPSGLSSVHVTLGGRLDRDVKSVKDIYTRFGTTPYPYNSLIPEASHGWNAATYRIGLSYDVNTTSLLYADTATGFKAGGYGYGPGLDIATGPIYQPEKITAYEFGTKNRFLGNTLQVNVEAFLYKYTAFVTNLSLTACTPSCNPGLPVLTVENAGQATYKGATADIHYLFTPADEVDLDVTTEQGKYGNYVEIAPLGYSLAATGTTTPITSTSSLTNTPIPGIPKWAGTLSYAHTWGQVLGGSLNAKVAAQYRGTDLLGVTTDAKYGNVSVTDHSWAMWDLSLQYQREGAPWSATAYVHNLTNALHPVTGTEVSSTHVITEAFFPPRIIGVVVKANLN